MHGVPADLGNSMQLSPYCHLVLHMFEDLIRQDQIERVVLKR